MTFQPYPTGLPVDDLAARGLHLLTQNTPNGQKVQILLEELADIDTNTNEQKRDWFLALNPNGRIPVIIDHAQSPPFPVMETSAELLCLLKFDTNNTFGFTDALEQNHLIQWLFFWHGSGAPYQGNLNFFKKGARTELFHLHRLIAIERFRKETLRVFGVLELHLSGKLTGQAKKYLAGNGEGKYSVADMGAWAWVKNWPVSCFTNEEMKAFPSLLDWIARIAERPAFQRVIGEKYALKQ